MWGMWARGQVCSGAEALFDRIRRHLAQEVVPTALRAGFLTPCQDQLGTAVMLELFACADGEFMDKFSMAGAVQSLKVCCFCGWVTQERHVCVRERAQRLDDGGGSDHVRWMVR